MQVRTVTPSQPNFGMAFVKPTQMGKFKSFVTEKEKDSALIGKGLEQIIKEQKNNKHFDIWHGYDGDTEGIMIRPNSAEACKTFRDIKYSKDIPDRETPLTIMQEKLKKEKALLNQSTSWYKKLVGRYRVFLAERNLKNMLKNNPKYHLPKNLLYASEDATMLAEELDEILKTEKNIENAFKDY